MYALSFSTMSLWNLHCCAHFTMQKLEFIEPDLPKHTKQESNEAPVWTQMSGSSTHSLCSTTLWRSLCFLWDGGCSCTSKCVEERHTAHNSARKELEALQMKVRMLYLHWMFLAFLFSTYQASREGAGTSLFCSIPFKHEKGDKVQSTSSPADSCLLNQQVLINPSIVPHMSISTKDYRGEINVRINSKWASLLFVTNYIGLFLFLIKWGELGGYWCGRKLRWHCLKRCL